MHAYLTRLTTLLLSLFSFFTGAFFLLATLSPSFRKNFIEQLKENRFSTVLISITLIAFAAFLLTNIWMERRRKHIYFHNAQGDIHIHKKVAKVFIQSYLEKIFQNKPIHCEVFVKRHKLAIECNLPFVPEEAQEGIAKAINEELSKILPGQIGYTKRFSLNISYAPEQASHTASF